MHFTECYKGIQIINGQLKRSQFCWGAQNTSQPENSQADVTLFYKDPYSSIKPMLENADPGSVHLSATSVIYNQVVECF